MKKKLNIIAAIFLEQLVNKRTSCVLSVADVNSIHAHSFQIFASDNLEGLTNIG